MSAASSLSDVFVEIESAFEAANPDVDVKLNIAGSSLLTEQALSGAPVDVLAAADVSHIATLVDSNLIAGSADVFAVNRLQLAVPVGNPGDVSDLGDLENPALFVGLCDEPVPCGRYAREVLDNAGVTASVDTNEPNVRSLLTKIAASELDVGIVYVTDVLAAEDEVSGIPIGDSVNVRADYPIAVLAEAPNPDLASLFVDFVLSDEGRSILKAHGFGEP